MDLLADNESPAVERLVPDHAEVFAVQLPFCGKPGPGIAPKICGHPVKVSRQRDVLGHSVKSQFTHGLVPLRNFLVTLHFVRHRRMLLHVEEVRIPQVAVALDVVGIHGRRLDRRLNGLDRAGLRIHVDQALEVREASRRLRHEHVYHAEFNRRVLGVHVPAGRLRLNGRGQPPQQPEHGQHRCHARHLSRHESSASIVGHRFDCPPALLSYFFGAGGGASGFPLEGFVTDCTSRGLARAPVRMRTCTSTASSPNSVGKGGKGCAFTTA